MEPQKLEWDENYSVGVQEIDNQHKILFATINELLDAIHNNEPEEKLDHIIQNIITYKKHHFSTEEKYFKEFNFEGAEEHIEQHKKFNDNIKKLFEDHPKHDIELCFLLIDFLEDWLIDHLQNMDQKYVECFKQNGLK